MSSIATNALQSSRRLIKADFSLFKVSGFADVLSLRSEMEIDILVASFVNFADKNFSV